MRDHKICTKRLHPISRSRIIDSEAEIAYGIASMATRIGRSSYPLRGSIAANHTPVFARTWNQTGDYIPAIVLPAISKETDTRRTYADPP